MDGIQPRPTRVPSLPLSTNTLESEEKFTSNNFNIRSRRHFYIRGILAFLICTTVTVGSFYFFHRLQASQQTMDTQTKVSAQYPNSPTPAVQSQTEAPLQPYLTNFSERSQGGGVVVIDLKSNETVSSNPDKVFTAASLYKLFVAESVYRAIEDGRIKPSTSTYNCLRIMITISDNRCGELLGSMVGWDRQNPRLHQLGYTHTRLSTYGPQQTTAHDTALLLQRLYHGELLNTLHTQSLLSHLKDQTINNRLPTGLPPGTTIAHKTGDLNGYVHDAGIVLHQDSQYVIVALSGPWKNSANAPAQFKQLSHNIHTTMLKK